MNLQTKAEADLELSDVCDSGSFSKPCQTAISAGGRTVASRKVPLSVSPMQAGNWETRSDLDSVAVMSVEKASEGGLNDGSRVELPMH